MFWSLCIYYLAKTKFLQDMLVTLYVFFCMSVCLSVIRITQKSIKLNRMKFGGLIGYYTGTIWLDFGSDRVKGQGHEKVKIVFLP